MILSSVEQLPPEEGGQGGDGMLTFAKKLIEIHHVVPKI